MSLRKVTIEGKIYRQVAHVCSFPVIDDNLSLRLLDLYSRPGKCYAADPVLSAPAFRPGGSQVIDTATDIPRTTTSPECRGPRVTRINHGGMILTPTRRDLYGEEANVRRHRLPTQSRKDDPQSLSGSSIDVDTGHRLGPPPLHAPSPRYTLHSLLDEASKATDMKTPIFSVDKKLPLREEPSLRH